MIVENVQMGDLISWFDDREDKRDLDYLPITWAFVIDVWPSVFFSDRTMIALFGVRSNKIEYWVWPLDFVEEHMSMITRMEDAIQ